MPQSAADSSWESEQEEGPGSDSSNERKGLWRQVREELPGISMGAQKTAPKAKKANEHAGKGRYTIPMGMGHPGRPAQVTPAHPSRL